MFRLLYNMLLTEFHYDLPEELIAKFPPKVRTQSRLMVPIDDKDNKNKQIKQLYFKDIVNLFNPGDLLILNNTKVLPARFYGHKKTGAKIEFLFERAVSESLALVYIKANKSPKPGLVINLFNIPTNISTNISITLTVKEKQDNLYLVELNQNGLNISWLTLLEKIGTLPLPPYINRQLTPEDETRYQTVYACQTGAVAAPTAGLHFDQELLQLLADHGVEIKYITLHVGSGTFQPVRVDNILDHKMHKEIYSINLNTLESIYNIKYNNIKSRIIAVGTTSLRCLESVADLIEHKKYCDYLDQDDHYNSETEIFIYPGYKFKLVDSLITNFHLSGSTLMMLVSAFAGLDNIKYYYQQAIENKYRFYSYGDAMWLDCAE